MKKNFKKLVLSKSTMSNLEKKSIQGGKDMWTYNHCKNKILADDLADWHRHNAELSDLGPFPSNVGLSVNLC